MADSAEASAAVLAGFDPEAPQPHLRFGDSIALVPRDVNGIAAYAGASDLRPWVQELQQGVVTPPNLRDCHFRLLPRRQYGESKALKKLVSKGVWDGGRNLQIPTIPPEIVDVTALANSFADKHRLEDKSLVVEVFQQAQAAQEENEGNLAEADRQMGTTICYGDSVQLQHVSTGSTITITKQQALERGSKKVEMLKDGNDASVFEIAPAFKTHSQGEPVSSGDLIKLTTKKRISGLHFSLHMSTLDGNPSQQEKIKRQLQVDHPALVKAEEMNATTGDLRPTSWRPMLFQPYENLRLHHDRFKAEDVICLYHKEAEAYLDYQPTESEFPCFRISRRVALKARKKSSWMWKIEADHVHRAGSQVVCSDTNTYRIKHLVTQKYLKRKGDSVEMTTDYTDENTLFTFRIFAKSHDDNFVNHQSLVYIRTFDRHWMTQVETDHHGISSDKNRKILMSSAEFVSERDAVMIMPLLPAAIEVVVRVRRAVQNLKDYAAQLEAIPDCPTPSELEPPKKLGVGAEKVAQVTAEFFEIIKETLTGLILNCTFDDDKNPMSRDGSPNKALQKLLRELGAIKIVMELVQKPFRKGLSFMWMNKKDKRFEKVVKMIALSYRLMKQVVKHNLSNAKELYNYVDVIRSHLGKGLSCTTTLKEMYAGKRDLLREIKEDTVQQFVDLLTTMKDPRYVDFLLSICSCEDEPIPNNQGMITELLLKKNPQLLPYCRIEKADGSHVRLGIWIPGTKDQNGNDFWIDVNKFKAQIVKDGFEQDLAGWILNAPYSELDEQQKLFRYFIRMTNLFGKLAMGRNQTALAQVLTNEHMCFKYEEILMVMKEEAIPKLVRARFTTMMLRFYVDRDPQASQPQVLYTRAWSSVTPEHSDLQISGATTKAIAPVAKDFNPLCDYILEALPRLGDDAAKEGSIFMGPESTFGQLELIKAQIEVADWLVDFGFFLKDRDTTKVDFGNIRKICSALVAILKPDTETKKQLKAVRETFMLHEVRSDALSLLLRIFNLRANFRISMCQEIWEAIFDEMTAKSVGKNKKFVEMKSFAAGSFGASSASTFDLQKQEVKDLFREHEQKFKSLEDSLFNNSIVCPEDFPADQYAFGHHRSSSGDRFVKLMMSLLSFKATHLSLCTTSLLFRNLGQRARVVEDLRLCQVLVFPAAVKVYEETERVIKRLTALKKSLSQDLDEAYTETIALLERMTAYVTLGPSNPMEIVTKNQKIMLNRELDEPVVDLLRLKLERDTSARDAGEVDADPAKNPSRRQLFQYCYNFLKALTANHVRAQKKLFPLIGTFSDHMGIRELNVADTIKEIVRDNPGLCQQVPEEFFRHFVTALNIYGRKARWLSFFEVFVEIKGEPFKRNQDVILRLILEDKDYLIDLECDYSSSPHLPKSDKRSGMVRVDLINQDDHLLPVRSLLKYHYVSIHLLALCAAGKNPANKARIFHWIDFEQILTNILDTECRPDGTKEAKVSRDAVSYVRAAWTKLLTNVYLTSLDTYAVKKIQQCERLWFNSSSDSNVGLVGEFCQAIQLLYLRLEKRPAPSDGKPSEELSKVSDSEGTDLGSHFEYVHEVIEALKMIFTRSDIYDNASRSGAIEELIKELYKNLVAVYSQLKRLKYYKLAHSVEQLVSCVAQTGIQGFVKFNPIPDDDDDNVGEATKESKFSDGWLNFRVRLADHLGVNESEGRTMDAAIQDLAYLFGSEKSAENQDYKSLQHLMELLCDENCDEFVLLNGLKVIRAILYIQPDNFNMTEKDRNWEYDLMLANKPPTAAGNEEKEFKHLQTLMAKKGGVDVVVRAIANDNKEVVYAGLCLAVCLLEGGNKKVQNLFATTLTPASSQEFFLSLQHLFDEAIEGIKESKRKQKQKEAEREALRKAGVKVRGPAGPQQSLGESQKYMTEVMKVMRRMCLGQHHHLQNILRRQRLNRKSIDFFEEAVKYLIAIEPELKTAFLNDDDNLIEGAIRGFLMLADAMHGPNYGNQDAISNTGIFDLGDRIFGKIRFEEQKTGRGDSKMFRRNSIAPADWDYDRSKNILRGRLKSAVTSCLLAFLEGVQKEAIPQQMLQTVQWSAITQQMDHCFRMRDNGTVVDTKACIREGINYYFLMKFLKHYDHGNAIIAPALKQYPDAVSYFDNQTGYVEIFRHERLERVYFQLPGNCVPGGPLDKPFEEMYETEREDPDKKNQEFLENMLRLVSREELHSNIRHSKFAFTVNRWDTIKYFSFLWAALIHFVLVMGSYTPHGTYEDDYHTIIDDGGDDLGKHEKQFYYDVHPYTQHISRYMVWVQLLITLVRFFSFAWAELPIIISEGLESADQEEDVHQEEEEESDDEDDGMADGVFSFVEDQEDDVSHQLESSVDNDEEEESKEGPPSSFSLFGATLVVFSSFQAVYELCFVAFMALGAVFDEPLLSCYALLEICFWKGSKTVIDAIYFNMSKMVQTVVLGILVMYIWMIIGIFTVPSLHDEGYCTNMFQCFLAYTFKAMRDNGVHEMLIDPVFPMNIWDAVVGVSQNGDSTTVVWNSILWRMTWDIVYQFLFLYILLSIITGIIIDAFGGLRDEKEAMEADLKANCFVCNLDRFRVDQHGIGFDKHVKIEHNPKWYLFFMMYLSTAKTSELSGQMRYIKEQVWPAKGNPSYKWLPREITFTLDEEEEGDDSIAQIKDRMSSVESKMDSVLAAVSKISEGLSAFGNNQLSTPSAGRRASVSAGRQGFPPLGAPRASSASPRPEESRQS